MAEVLLFCFMVAKSYDIPVEILPAIIKVESDYRQHVVSHKGAVGMMQVTRPAFLDYKRANPNGRVTNFMQVRMCWRANINVGAWYLSRVCYRQKGNWKEAITAYFWGVNHPEPTEVYYNKVKKNKIK